MCELEVHVGVQYLCVFQLPCCDPSDQLAAFCYHMLIHIDFFEHCHVRRY